MRKTRFACAVFAVAVGIIVTDASVAEAQTSATAASTPKQVRKAQRKAARAKKNEELKTLEKNGYQPSGNQSTYPEDIQNAQRKAAAANGQPTTPASGP